MGRSPGGVGQERGANTGKTEGISTVAMGEVFELRHVCVSYHMNGQCERPTQYTGKRDLCTGNRVLYKPKRGVK